VKWARGQISPPVVLGVGPGVAVLVDVTVGIMFLGGLKVGVAVWVAVAVAVGRSVAVGSGVFVFTSTTGFGSVGCTAAGPEQALEITKIIIRTKTNFFIRVSFFTLNALILLQMNFLKTGQEERFGTNELIANVL